MAEALRAQLGLDGRGRLLDVGCGPGSAALVFAPLFEQVVGVDADADMIAEAHHQAAGRGVENAEWLVLRAEELPAGLGSFRVATFAQSFHWMDRPRVAQTVKNMLDPDGAWVHVNATTHRGAEGDQQLPGPTPPRDQITELVHRYLGPIRRAGRSILPQGTAVAEDAVMVAAGFIGPRKVVVARGEVHERSEDDIVASIYSLSSAAPHLFGPRLTQFETDLRALLRRASAHGRFYEQARDIELVIWGKPS
jgi:SAM-dependent methyltransferase